MHLLGTCPRTVYEVGRISASSPLVNALFNGKLSATGLFISIVFSPNSFLANLVIPTLLVPASLGISVKDGYRTAYSKARAG